MRRDRQQIDAKVAQLHAAGADYLADCIVRVGPQNGDPVTNAVPYVVAAEPGIVTLADLPPITGYGAQLDGILRAQQ